MESGINIQLVHGQRVLDPLQAKGFLVDVYSLLDVLPKRIRLFEVRFNPAMNNVGGWHPTGVHGHIRTLRHRVSFVVNDDVRRNSIFYFGSRMVDHDCRCKQVANRGIETMDLTKVLIQLLRDLATEEIDLLKHTYDLSLVRSFLKDPLVVAAS